MGNCICDPVPANASAKDDHTHLYGFTSKRIQGWDVADDVQNQTRRLERMEINHIPDEAIRQCRTKDGNTVSSCKQAQQIPRGATIVFTLYAPQYTDSSLSTPSPSGG